VVGFQIRFCASTGHLKTGPFDNQTKMSGFRMASLDRFIIKRVTKKYFIHKKTFGSHLVLTIRNWDKKVRFSDGRNKMVAKLFEIQTICPVFKTKWLP
jgi:hypothetical protein